MKPLPDHFYRNICENFGFIFIAVDRDLKIVFWNDEAAKHFGQKAAEMVGQPFLPLVPECYRDEAAQLFKQTLQAKKPVELEVKYPVVDDKPQTLVLLISPVVNEAGECVGACAAMRDISRRKQLSQELARSQRMAALGSMSGAVAHHFNNILGGMQTSIDYVLASDSPRELRRTLRLLSQAIGRATRITKQLAAFAESENERCVWGTINSLMDDFINRFKPKAEQASITIQEEIQQVNSDPYEAQRLLPVLESLGQNSLDSMASGGTLTVRLEKQGDRAMIVIADTGCGMPEEVQERLFEPFFTTKGGLGGGTSENIGLGLAAVHGLVSEMDGTIRIKSKVGTGTQAEISLPLQRKLDEQPDPNCGH